MSEIGRAWHRPVQNCRREHFWMDSQLENGGQPGPPGNRSVARWKNSSCCTSNIIPRWPGMDVGILAPPLLLPTRSPHLYRLPFTINYLFESKAHVYLPDAIGQLARWQPPDCGGRSWSKTNAGSAIEPKRKRREKSQNSRQGSTGLGQRPPCPKRDTPIWSFCMLDVRRFPPGHSLKRHCRSSGPGAKRPVCRSWSNVSENAGRRRSGKPPSGSDVLRARPVVICWSISLPSLSLGSHL